MLNCCISKKTLENVISPEPISSNSIELREVQPSIEKIKSDPIPTPLSFSIYINSSDKSPKDQIKDLMKNYILNDNTRIILAGATFNISNNYDSIDGIENMSTYDIYDIMRFIKSTNSKISLSIGGKYHFANSQLYNKPTELANNINGLLQKYKFDGVDFYMGDSSNVPSNFIDNASSLINTLRSINNNLHITLTTAAQAWAGDNYEEKLIKNAFNSINAWQVMEHDLYYADNNSYVQQIKADITYYTDTSPARWNINSNKIIVVLKPGIDNTNIDDIHHKLSLSDTKSLTQYIIDKKFQGVCIWTSYIDSKGCDGNVPNKYSTEIKKLFELYPPGPYPPPPSPPTSPLFTNDEIKQIQSNLDIIMDFNNACFNEQGQVINEVFTKLHGSQYLPPDSGNPLWQEIIKVGLEILATAVGNPVLSIAVLIFNEVCSYTSENAAKLANYLNVNLDNDASDLFGRNINSYNANQIYLGFMHEYTNLYRDQPFTFNNKTYTLRDLISITLPTKEDPYFNILVQVQCRAFRQQITIPEMIKMQFWDIYFVQDNSIPKVYFGEAYRPPDITITGGNQRIRTFDQNSVGNNVRIFANDEVWHAQPSYDHIEAFGNDNNDLKSSYLSAINRFIIGIESKSDGFPAALVHPWTVTNKSVYSYRWYIFQGFGKPASGTTNYTIANGEFIKWLFIDDGAGNITNENGVIYRYDILTSGVFSFQNALPKENFLPSDETILFKSTDYDYMYPGCPNIITSNRICINNLYNYKIN